MLCFQRLELYRALPEGWRSTGQTASDLMVELARRTCGIHQRQVRGRTDQAAERKREVERIVLQRIALSEPVRDCAHMRFVALRSFVLREEDQPFRNVSEYGGLDASRIEAMEQRLKDEVSLLLHNLGELALTLLNLPLYTLADGYISCSISRHAFVTGTHAQQVLEEAQSCNGSILLHDESLVPSPSSPRASLMQKQVKTCA